MSLPDHHDLKSEAGTGGAGERRAQGNLRLIFAVQRFHKAASNK